MPLGAIHLIVFEPHGENSQFLCGISDAIAAIHPERLQHFPEESICKACLEAYKSLPPQLNENSSR
jgi:hypothetical protein